MSKDLVVKAAIENDVKEVVIREGKSLEVYNNKPVKLTGNIDAPSRFIEGRKEDFENSRRHCMVSKTDGIIELVINEQSVCEKYEITGKIEIGKKFKSLGINDDNNSYTPEELANKLKLLRSIFVSNIEHAGICTQLRNLKATINRDIEAKDDRKGNVERNFKQTVDSNVPGAVKIKLPLLEGEDDVEFEVNIILEAVNSSGINCYLESIDASEMIEEAFKQRVSQEIDKIKEWVTIIEH